MQATLKDSNVSATYTVSDISFVEFITPDDGWRLSADYIGVPIMATEQIAMHICNCIDDLKVVNFKSLPN